VSAFSSSFRPTITRLRIRATPKSSHAAHLGTNGTVSVFVVRIETVPHIDHPRAKKQVGSPENVVSCGRSAPAIAGT
jgi:hypothetical protein